MTQEIIFQLLKSLDKGVLLDSPEKYLWKIAYYTWCNKAKEYIKDKKQITDNILLNQVRDDDIDIVKVLEKEELKSNLNSSINNFNEPMKGVLKLYYYDDLKIKDISMKLSITESLVKYYLYEGRKKIKKEFMQEMEI